MDEIIPSQFTEKVSISILLKDIKGVNILNEEGNVQYKVVDIPIINDISGKTIIDGNIQYIDKLNIPISLNDISGENIIDTLTMTSVREIIYEYSYNLRYLNTLSEIITKEEYDISGGYIAAYIGCTYHCG